MISDRLREGPKAGADLRWHVPDIQREAADVIDALVAALEAAASSAGFQYMMHETRDQIDAALAMARRNR